MNEEQEEKLIDSLKLIVDQLHEMTGEKFLIGFSYTKGDIIQEGCVSSDKLDWSTACKMLVGITSFVGNYYGNLSDNV